MSDRFALVALPLPLATPYTYRIPETLGDRVVPGARVVVPVRRRELIGLVVAVDARPPDASARDVLAVPDAEPALSAALLATAEWIAGYYGAPLGLTLKSSLARPACGGSRRSSSRCGMGRRVTAESRASCSPGWSSAAGRRPCPTAARALKRPLWDVIERLTRVDAVTLRVQPPDTSAAGLTERVLSLTDERPTLLERETLFKRRPKQQQLYETLEALGGSASVRHLSEQLGFGDGVLKALVREGLARVGRSEVLRDPFAGSPAHPHPPSSRPTSPLALSAISALEPGEGALLFGVTGSGKTLVYLEAVRRALAAGQGRHRARAGDRSHAADREPVSRRVRRRDRGAPQRVVRWRARRCLATAPARRAAGGGGCALRGVRAGSQPRHDRDRRGARGQLQERRDAALPHPGRGGGACPARGGATDPGKRDTVTGDDGRRGIEASTTPACQCASAPGRCRR